MENEKQFEILYINTQFEIVCEYVYGFSAIVEENLFKTKNSKNIHKFIQIAFIKYI